jgi:hypothetical protein
MAWQVIGEKVGSLSEKRGNEPLLLRSKDQGNLGE